MNDQVVRQASQDRTSNKPLRLVRVSRDSPLPVSLAQEAILPLCHTPEERARCVLAKIHQIVGPLDIMVLRDCLTYIACRHEILRTTFGVENGQPVQIIHPAEPIFLSIFEATHRGDLKREAARIIKEETSRLADLTQGPLIRFSLLHIDENEHWLFRICQHLIWDAWSTKLFCKELALLYEARLQARPAPLPQFEEIQYADYASWQRKILPRDGLIYQEAIGWWKGHFQREPAHLKRPWPRKFLGRNGVVFQKARLWLKGHSRTTRAPLELPFKRPKRLTGLDPTEGTIDCRVPLGLEQRLNWLSRNSRTTMFVIWLAALVAFLAAETGQSDIIVGTYMSSRRHPSLRNKIGCFAHFVALRFQCDPARPFSDWLSEIQSWVTAAQDRCEIPNVELRSVLHGLGVPAPEVQVIFRAPMGTGRVEMHFAGLELFGIDLCTETTMPSNFRIDLLKIPHQICRGYFDAEIYDPKGVRQFLGRLCEFLEALARHPSLSIRQAMSK